VVAVDLRATEGRYKFMKLGFLILLVFISSLFSVRADSDSSALEKLRQIPPSSTKVSFDSSKRAPVVVVKAQGVFINSKGPIPFDQVLRALADLPKEAWPYGRAITFFPSPPGIHQPGDGPSPADAKRVEADLKRAEFYFLPVLSM
jgi:hypothetical protein